jgi:hypothetical protein
MSIRHIFKDTTKSPLDHGLSVTVMALIFNKYHGKLISWAISQPILIFLTGKCELNCKCLILYNNILYKLSVKLLQVVTRSVLDRFQDSSKTSSRINFFPTFLAAFFADFFQPTFLANYFPPFFRKINFERAVQTFAALWREFCRLIARDLLFFAVLC